ncbi:MAG: DnaJ domain-containing protein [Bdellovibrionota bacterium]
MNIKDTGELKKKSAFSLLYQAICDQYNGVFVFASGKEKHSVVIENQKLKTPLAIVNEATLGKYFFEQGVLSDTTFMQVKKVQQTQGIPFFQAAIQSNLVRYDQIQSYVNTKMNELFDALFSWQDGKYIVVSQIPKDVVPIEITEAFFIYLFERRLTYHQKIKPTVPDEAIIFKQHPQLSIDALSLTPTHLKILQTLKKTKKVKSVAQFVGAPEWEVHCFVRTLLDFELVAFEKTKAQEETKLKYYAGFDFKKIYDNYGALTFYELLGLPSSVSSKDVVPQYFEIAKHYHPDRFKLTEGFTKEKTEKVFARITEAYQNLSKVALKQAYDEKLSGNVEKQVDVEKVVKSESLFLDGMDFLRRGQFDKACTSFKEAIALYSQEYEYFIRLGWAEYRMGLKTNDNKLIESGKSAIAKALKQDKAKDDVYYYQGLIFKHEGEFEKSKASFQRCLNENKNHLQASQELRAVAMLLEKRTTNKKGWFK